MLKAFRKRGYKKMFESMKVKKELINNSVYEILNNESKKIRKQELKSLIKNLKKEVNKK